MTLEQKIRTVEILCNQNSCMTCPCRDREKFGITCRFDPNTPWFKQPAHILDEALELFGKKTVYTNFDYIKDMTVEEMAEFIFVNFQTDEWFNPIVDNKIMFHEDDVAEWLESEVQGE